MEKNEENNKTSKIKDFSSEKKKKRRLSENKSNSEVNDKNTNRKESDKDNKDNVQTNIKKEIKENPKNEDENFDENNFVLGDNMEIIYYVSFPTPDIAFDFKRYMSILKLINPTFKDIKVQLEVGGRRSPKKNTINKQILEEPVKKKKKKKEKKNYVIRN